MSSAAWPLRDHRTGDMVEAVLGRDLAAALDTARDVAESGVDIKTFTRGVIEELRERLNAVAHGEDGDLEQLIGAITELSGADFRLDPGNPVPLELACASAILGPRTRAAAPASEAETARPAGGERAKKSPPRRGDQGGGCTPRRRQRDARAGSSFASSTTAARWSTDPRVRLAQRYLRSHLHRRRRSSASASSWPSTASGSTNDFRDLVEQEASQILGRTVRIEPRWSSARRGRGGNPAAATWLQQRASTAPPPSERKTEQWQRAAAVTATCGAPAESPGGSPAWAREWAEAATPTSSPRPRRC
ncbi:MAG: hypothetical protein U5Q44_03400 [Dehalococcoidia bacterium]|nr:hypothetical protein [Dehalococcoidia bacterium]